MHHESAQPIMHRDIKSSNILLDPGFRAKIADFGLARILSRAGESEPASGICRTFGYIAPGMKSFPCVNREFLTTRLTESCTCSCVFVSQST